MSYYVYKFLNDKSEIIYIGQTTNIRERIEKQHFTKNGHLPKECYNQSKSIYYANLSTKTDMDITERFLISKYRPKYNTVGNTCDVTLDLNEPEWIEYNHKVLAQNAIVEKLKNNHNQEINKYETHLIELHDEYEDIIKHYQSKINALETKNATLKDRNEFLEKNNAVLAGVEKSYKESSEMYTKALKELGVIQRAQIKLLVRQRKGTSLSDIEEAMNSGEFYKNFQEEIRKEWEEFNCFNSKPINKKIVIKANNTIPDTKNKKRKGFLYNLKTLFIG